MKHSLVRQTIVNTASDLFYKNGYNLTGINEIIKEAGIAKATLYSHFKSKEDICIAYLQHRNSTFTDKIRAFAESKKAGAERVLAVFDYLNSFFKDKSFNGCWCINTYSEIPRDNVNIRSVIQKQKREFMELIQQLTVDSYPELPEAKQKLIGKQVYLLYESAISESHIHQAAWPIQDAKLMAENILSQ